MRIGILTFSNCLAHAGRTVMIARELQERGHKAVLFGSTKYFQNSLLVEGDEFEFHKTYEPDIKFVGGQPMPREHKRLMRGWCDAYIEQLKQVDLDCVVVDNVVPAFMVAARTKRVPVFTISNAVLSRPYCNLQVTRDEYMEYVGPAMGFMPSLSGLVYEKFKRKRSERELVSRRITTALAEYGLAGQFKYMHEFTFGDLAAIVDDPLLFPMKDLPDHIRMVGPLKVDVGPAPPNWLYDLPDRPNVLITFGSTGNEIVLQTAVEQLSTMDYNVVVLGGPLNIKHMPTNVHKLDYCSMDGLTRWADVVVCHGGHGTVHHALEMIVPMVGIPTHFEQALELIPFFRRGLAMHVAKTDIYHGCDKLFDAVEQALSVSEQDHRWFDAVPDEGWSPATACADMVEELL